MLRSSRRLIVATAAFIVAGFVPVLPAGAEPKTDGTLDVVGQNYEFEGDLSGTPTIAPGRYTINFSNPATPGNPELHEVAVVHLRDGQTLAQAFEGTGKVKFVGGAFAPDGASSTGRVKLDKEGRYGFVCFVPFGSDTPTEEDDGPPHAFGGMVGEFFVQSE